MPTTLELILSDPGFETEPWDESADFQAFVETIPNLLEDIWKTTLTVSVLMEAQYRCIDAFADLFPAPPVELRQLRSSVSQHENADVFLYILGITEKQYCVETSGMCMTEYSAMQEGELTLERLWRRHPAVLLAPLLKRRKLH